ncbi:MAG TPA: RsmE family RNA methyltransferase, partial [Ferruginibacter sp.]|nr:RsmE family RNA methyltransferase [Ferruginibacter sp.]
SKHIIQVLRMKKGEHLQLTDGKGNLITASIADDNRKKCSVTVSKVTKEDRSPVNTAVAISLTKNNSRFEWFLEKATELGVSYVIPLICERTEKQKFRLDRMKNILVSAMLQSQQCWLPELQEPMQYHEVLENNGSSYQQKFIAHCIEQEKRNLSDLINESLPSRIILIGPEGDFTPAEVQHAIDHHFIPVALGNTRLRTETAGIVAATLLCVG